MIKSPEQLATMDKKIRMLLAGYPGIGKSTLALSAPKPLHIDVDKGIDRIDASHRKSFIQPETYQELLDDLRVDNPLLREFETLVIDTGGQMIKLMATHVIGQDAKNGKRDGSLSLQGYGAVGREFERLMNYCYYTLNKHVVITFHAKEDKDGDNTRLRLLVEGQTKDNVWQPMDLGGFMEIIGNERVLRFDNNERHFGKCCHGIKGTNVIPNVKIAPNTFLTDLFAQVQANIAEDAISNKMLLAEYENAMTQINEVLLTIEDAESATRAVDMMKSITHTMTSRVESSHMLMQRAKELGLRWDRGAGAYVSAVEQSA